MDIFFILAPIIFFIIAHICKNEQYKKGTYYRITRNSYSSVKYDKGKYAEYLTYECLRHLENNGSKFLFNALITKRNGETTEIDVLMICSKGLFVFECKNYSGWIFGNETQKNWTQTLPQGRGRCHKEHFYNPIMQNASHIKHLKNLIGKNVPTRSVIVFSNRCVLKDVRIKSDDIRVINHHSAASVVTQMCNETKAEIYTETEINDIYNKLYPYTQFDYKAKEQHIESTRKRLLLIKEKI
ncbi:MAG: nuclease-related domain-containing protein [Gammaproteobacteria bacterium]